MFDWGERHSLAERAPLSDKPKVVGQKHSSLPSDEDKDLPLKISIPDFDKLLAEILKQGRFPLQYYNRSGAKKASGADWSGQRRTSVQNV